MLNVNEKKEVKPKSTSEIGTIGERLVAASLQKEGFTTNIDTKGPGATDIEAVKEKLGILVQVKTGVEPNLPADLSAEEESAIKRRAGQKKYTAYEAKVQLDKNYAFKKIDFRELKNTTSSPQ